MQDFRLPPLCTLCLRSSGVLCGVPANSVRLGLEERRLEVLCFLINHNDILVYGGVGVELHLLLAFAIAISGQLQAAAAFSL